MFKADLIGSDSLVREIRRDIEQQIQKLSEEVNATAKATTPIKTGRARKGWNKKTNPQGFTVENRVPYIERLEAGASRQAPKGIIGPTLSKVKGK